MAVKDIIAGGFGFTPESNKFIFTRGFGPAVSPVFAGIMRFSKINIMSSAFKNAFIRMTKGV